MLKTAFSKAEPKLVHYRKYKTFSFECFKVSLENALGNCLANYDDLNQIFTFRLNQTWIGGNHKYMNIRLNFEKS